MRRIVMSLIAAGLLIGGAFVAGVVGSSPAAGAQDSAEALPVERARPDRAGIVDAALADLVADGVLTQDQAEAVKNALRAKMEEVRRNRAIRERREEFDRGARFGFRLRELLRDGVIDSDELAQLPQDHPLLAANGPLAEYLDDGELTVDELREARARQRSREGFERGARFGFRLRELLRDGVIDADELAQLPQDHPLLAADGPLAEYLDDGELTVDELREARDRHRSELRAGGASGG